MIQGNLKTFQTDYSAIMKQEKALLSEYLSSEQNTQSSSPDLKPTAAESPAQDPLSPLLKSIPVLQEHFTRLEMEMVQLRETVLKQEHHTELQQNSEHITQRLSALTQQVKGLQTEKDSCQKELATLRLQLQDREHLTLEMRQQLRELQEEREQQHSEIQALKEQVRELLLTRQEPEQIHRAQTLASTPEPPATVSQHPERPDPDRSQSSQRLVSSAPAQHQQHPSDSTAPTSSEQPEIALLIDSNGKFIDIKKLFPRHRALKHWCPNTDKALELLTESQLGHPSHIIIHTGTNDLRSQQDRVSDSLRAVVEKARHTFPNSKIILSTLLQRKDFHPNTISKINANISRHCALVPNVYLAHHPDLDTDFLYDHVHLYKNLVHILAKRLKDVTLNRTNQTSPRWSRTSPNPATPARHTSRDSIPPSTSSRAPSRASAPREEPHRQTLQKPHRFFPKIWNQGLISPIHKNGDKLEPNSYQGICVNSNLGKRRGVRQGCSLSPTLFNIYINQLANALEHAPIQGLTLHDTEIKCLLYADDLVLLSPTKEGLQDSLNLLEDYCQTWALTVNLQKTKVMIFQKRSRSQGLTHTFTLSHRTIETTKTYTYLGLKITPTATGPGHLTVIESTMNSSVSQSILESCVRPSVRQLKLGQYWVMQPDNDTKHTSKSTTQRLKKKRIKVLQQSSQSPDLILTEMLW
ncbi:uncharacterized protein LOC107695035 [Sinocyclocheilus anshuiensis]|uniref:uncharacterized protein LOC107695035 n=1 Tax=Sinocyclocheilus anshuiensis TaxID=1608454 RepID=UPI0007B8042E|nr:PREDICTED: uncharacterized protein LOC107695035 [Sinocyclocheilus anshuiensis]